MLEMLCVEKILVPCDPCDRFPANGLSTRSLVLRITDEFTSLFPLNLGPISASASSRKLPPPSGKRVSLKKRELFLRP